MRYIPDHDDHDNHHDKKQEGGDHNHERERMRDQERDRVRHEPKRQHGKTRKNLHK